MPDNTRYMLAKTILEASQKLSKETGVRLDIAVQAYVAANEVVSAVEENIPQRPYPYRGYHLQVLVDGKEAGLTPITWRNEKSPTEPPDWDMLDGCYGLQEHGGDDFYDAVLEMIEENIGKNGMPLDGTRTETVDGKSITFQVVKKPSSKEWGEYDDRPGFDRGPGYYLRIIDTPANRKHFGNSPDLYPNPEKEIGRDLGEGPWETIIGAMEFRDYETGIDVEFVYIDEAGNPVVESEGHIEFRTGYEYYKIGDVAYLTMYANPIDPSTKRRVGASWCCLAKNYPFPPERLN